MSLLWILILRSRKIVLSDGFSITQVSDPQLFKSSLKVFQDMSLFVQVESHIPNMLSI